MVKSVARSIISDDDESDDGRCNDDDGRSDDGVDSDHGRCKDDDDGSYDDNVDGFDWQVAERFPPRERDSDENIHQPKNPNVYRRNRNIICGGIKIAGSHRSDQTTQPILKFEVSIC